MAHGGGVVGVEPEDGVGDAAPGCGVEAVVVRRQQDGGIANAR
jgi:hypothetical protein